ncbi:MAG: D-alanyl-D-alanine carboxypeptidase/D-alanyl-D-alanine-endopeptidase [Betaproteobacteria bacterium]|nr:D-alanyl-D-alanine carboxypeptidase/D-alanyl-D-alanine-endopeptidase [Betaproteobacteria bacterium]
MLINHLSGQIGVIAALLLALATPLRLGAQIPVTAATELKKLSIPATSVGIHAVRIRDGRVTLSHQPDQPLQPASTLKVLTAIAALDMLGPTHTGKVELRSAAPVESGVLKGDLILRGEASPDFTWQELRETLQSLRFAGIREIAGDVIVDRGYFSPTRLDEGLPPFDETPEFRYNVIPDALLLNTNLHKLQLNDDGATLRINATPALDGVSFDAGAMIRSQRKCPDWEDGWKLPVLERTPDGRFIVRLQGDFPARCSTTTQISVLDRADFAARLIPALWRELGGTLTGGVRESVARQTPLPANTRVLATHRSRTLAEVTRDINKRSDNPITRLAFLTLGATAPVSLGHRGDATTVERAEARVRAWLRDRGVNDAGLVLDNGSGLSRTERASAAQLVAALRIAHASDWAPEFITALPIAATDGGLRNRYVGTLAARKARLKTGTLRNTWALAGFAPDANGDMIALAVIINDDRGTGPTVRPILDAIVLDILARHAAEAGDWPDRLTRESPG